MANNMGDTFNFNGSIGQFVKEGDGIIEHYQAQSVAASSSTQGTPARQDEAVSSAMPAEDGATGQLTNRQVVIMMAGLLDISLSPDYTNQKQLATFVSRITGRSEQSIRQTIMHLAKTGIETPQARKDSLLVADVLEPVCKKVAGRIRNDAEE